jgi:photosystem II stability/assembly factor-like uncharacterized protein
MKSAFFSLLVCLIGLSTNAQNWIQASGISDKIVRTIIAYNTDTILAGVDDEGIFISYDNGENWEHLALNGESVNSLIRVGTRIIAGTYGNDFFISETLNGTWENVLINNDLVINKLSVDRDTLFACTYGDTGPGALYFSADTGKTWDQYGITPPYAFLDIDFSSDGRTYVATPFGAYYSDHQSAWKKSTGFGGTVRTVKYLGNDSLIYGGEDGIFISADNGISGIALEGMNSGVMVHFHDDMYYATMAGSGLYYTNDIGSTWLSLDLDKYVLALLKVGEKLIAGTPEGIFLPADSPTLIYNHNGANYMHFFPNPVDEILHIELNNPFAQNSEISIYSVSGSLLRKSIFTGNKISLNLNDLQSGIYIVIMKDNEQTMSFKFLK